MDLGEAGSFLPRSLHPTGVYSVHVRPPSPCLAFALVSPDATISQFQSTQGWWDLTLFFAHQLRTSEKKRKGEGMSMDAFFKLFAPPTLPQGAATHVRGQQRGL